MADLFGCAGLKVRQAEPVPATEVPSSRPRSPTSLPGQLVEQRFGISQDMCVEAFGKPTVDRGQDVIGLGGTTLSVPELG